MWIKKTDTYYVDENGNELLIIEGNGTYTLYLHDLEGDRLIWQEEAETLEDAISLIEEVASVDET